jgi:hypothetical protein
VRTTGRSRPRRRAEQRLGANSGDELKAAPPKFVPLEVPPTCGMSRATSRQHPRAQLWNDGRPQWWRRRRSLALPFFLVSMANCEGGRIRWVHDVDNPRSERRLQRPATCARSSRLQLTRARRRRIRSSVEGEEDRDDRRDPPAAAQVSSERRAGRWGRVTVRRAPGQSRARFELTRGAR